MILLALSEGIFQKTKKLLEKENLKYKRIDDGEKLFEIAQEVKPELIILEKDIPMLDGFAVTLLLKADKTTNEIPVLVICKCAYKEEEIKARDCGADCVINYPFDEKLFIEIIKKLMREGK